MQLVWGGTMNKEITGNLVAITVTDLFCVPALLGHLKVIDSHSRKRQIPTKSCGVPDSYRGIRV